jgi:hypothetical protein
MVYHSYKLVDWIFDRVMMVVGDDLGEIEVLGDLYLVVHLLLGDLAEGEAFYLQDEDLRHAV